MTTPLTKANQAISLRITDIMQCGLPWEVLRQILVEVTNQDREFVSWMNINSPILVRKTGKDVTILDNPELPSAKGKFSRYPWFNEKGKLMIKLETISKIEESIATA